MTKHKDNTMQQATIKALKLLGKPADYNEVTNFIKANELYEFKEDAKNTSSSISTTLKRLVNDEEIGEIPDTKTSKYYYKYGEKDFFEEVYISEQKYQEIKNVLLRKKNIILQGAPGVGKTFSAKRLAYSIIGAIDNSYIEFVQFHQNYSYEEFVQGYKPTEDGGFKLENGIFYSFCERARRNLNSKYFFIIDEINRGNLSKIFGELLMLIENEHRGEEVALTYQKDKKFSVPENIYIIGMMNTADRSLAMIDYALRRRFSFVELNPGFETTQFKNYQNRLASDKFNRIITAIEKLNTNFEKGFCIGHSYFCNLDKSKNLEEDLKSIVDYEIKPMIDEYWFDNTDIANTQKNNLEEALNG